MKILIISPQNPYPPIDGGKIGIFCPIKHLLKHGVQVSICYFDKDLRKDIEKIGIKAFPCKLDTSDSLVKVVKNLVKKAPFKMQKYHSKKCIEHIFQIIESEKPDIVQVQHSHMGYYGIEVKKRFDLPIVLREHNIESELVKQFSKNVRFPLNVLAQWQFNKTRKYEAHLWAEFDKIIFISPNDLEIALQRNPKIKQKATFIVDGFQLEGELPVINKRDPHSLIFSANWKAPQNLHSAKWFIHQIWPYLKVKIPELNLWLTGQGEDRLLRVLKLNRTSLKKEDIHSLGFVEDINATITSKQIFISPTIMGSGVRLKILHAFSLGMPVICTSIDAKSLPYLKHRENVMVANTPGEWANAINELLHDQILREKISNNAKLLVMNYYNWDRYMKEVMEVYNSLQ